MLSFEMVQAAEPKRLALVIGNDAYQYISKLEKAGNDASSMARELKSAGFEVELRKDVNSKNLLRYIEAFTNRINGGDQVVVFYAGHGVQIKSGNYLLPTDTEVGSEAEIEKIAYSLDDLTAKLAEAKASFSLVMVDACRDNPLKAFGRSVGANRGLSAVEPPKGQIVVFSASRGQQALDKLSEKDNNPNGVFTREFIARMKKPGVKIQELMVEVQDAVENLAKSIGHDQRPALYNESRGNFYFYGSGSPQVTITTNKEVIDPEAETWIAANNANTIAAYELYLKAYPNGKYATAANIKVLNLQQSGSVKPVTTIVNTQPQADTIDAETAYWRTVEKNDLLGEYKKYLQIYPNGRFAEVARQKLQNNQKVPAPWARTLLSDNSSAYRITIQQWKKAENRSYCAPIGVSSNAGYDASPRVATFSGGWAIAYDTAALRSAYGIAGSGGRGVQSDEKLKTWPFFRAYEDGSAVGYGLSGAGQYKLNNPDGKGEESLAYLRINGQDCLYNVWSKLGRQHLEKLIGDLRMLKTP